jgi:hypothetical protein
VPLIARVLGRLRLQGGLQHRYWSTGSTARPGRSDLGPRS